MSIRASRRLPGRPVTGRLGFIVLLGSVLAGLVPAASAANDGAAATAGAFADPIIGGRGAALAGALCALVDDPSALYWNPARLLSVDRASALVSYADLFGLGLARQIGVFVALPSHEERLSWEDGRVAREAGPPAKAYGFGLHSTSVDLDPEKYNEYDFTAGFARRGWMGFGYSAVGHLLLVNSDLAGVDATGFSLDLALARSLHPRIDAGLTLRSVFSSLSWDAGNESLSPRAVFGIAARPIDRLAIPVAAMYDLDRAALIQFSGGAEWQPVGETLALRAGLRWRDDGADARVAGAAGVGLCWQQVTFDYGFAAEREELGDTHRLSLQVRF